MTNPFNIDLQRERIDAFKAERLANPYKAGALVSLSKEGLLQAWIEQQADASLYEEEWIKRDDKQEAALKELVELEREMGINDYE